MPARKAQGKPKRKRERGKDADILDREFLDEEGAEEVEFGHEVRGDDWNAIEFPTNSFEDGGGDAKDGGDSLGSKKSAKSGGFQGDGDQSSRVPLRGA